MSMASGPAQQQAQPQTEPGKQGLGQEQEQSDTDPLYLSFVNQLNVPLPSSHTLPYLIIWTFNLMQKQTTTS